jgi:hypothetical protein
VWRCEREVGRPVGHAGSKRVRWPSACGCSSMVAKTTRSSSPCSISGLLSPPCVNHGNRPIALSCGAGAGTQLWATSQRSDPTEIC